MTLLSVLDQSPVIAGHSAADAIAATIELAQLADDLGYTRYWCAEHHELLGDLEGAVIGQHDAARADPDALRDAAEAREHDF
ncbi:hypothetical protein ACLFKT_30630, partial [Paraburkholderia sp. BR14261]